MLKYEVMSIEDVQYHDNVNCKFSESLYQEMASERYGIAFCCETDKRKWALKKELLEFNQMKDLDLCSQIISCTELVLARIVVEVGLPYTITYIPCGETVAVTLEDVVDDTTVCANDSYDPVLVNLGSTASGNCLRP